MCPPAAVMAVFIYLFIVIPLNPEPCPGTCRDWSVAEDFHTSLTIR
jgi:hypothetical protein